MALHDPKIKEAFLEKGVQVRPKSKNSTLRLFYFLPKAMNSISLNTSIVGFKIGVMDGPHDHPVDEYDHFIRGPRTFKELEQILSDGVEFFNSNKTIKRIKGYYKNRATGKALVKRWKGSKVVEAIQEIREESGGQTFEFPSRI
jgi:hypothetical protein